VFTGIVEEAGSVRSLRQVSAGMRLVVEAQQIARQIKPGDSVAVNGVCLTVVENNHRSFSCDLSAETLRCSSFGRMREGMVVNLERPLAIGDRLGGHIVQGHVDGVGRMIATIPSGEGMDMEFSIPATLERYLISKGSVAVDGISLTIASLKKNAFTVAVIPHTYRVTNLRHLKPDDAVNLEGDVLAKYFERFFQLGLIGETGPKSMLTVDSLREQGY
jgi:riboflavin synthase